MNIKNFILLVGIMLLGQSTFATPTNDAKDKITVYIFLHESCLISQFYTLPLKELHSTFASKRLQFVGLFPNTSSQPKNIQKFKEKYQIPFELKTDHSKFKVAQFGATVTPEVVVYNETQNQVLYQGRIDNTYARVGKKRQVTTSAELKDALEAITNCETIAVTKTDPVGCFINRNTSLK